MKRTELKRKTPMKRGGSPLRRTRLARVSARNGDLRKIPPEVKAALAERSGWQCERIIPETGLRCHMLASDPHHVLERSQGGKHTLENLKHLCRPCHRLCKDEPRKMIKEGLVKLAGPYIP